MTRRHAFVAMCVALGISVAVNAYLWTRLPAGGDASRGAETRAASEARERSPGVPAAAGSPAGVPARAEPCPKPGAGTPERDTKTTRLPFETEQRVASWADEQERAVRARLHDMLPDAPDDAVEIECRASCCRLAPSGELDGGHLMRDVQSSVGFAGTTTRMIFGPHGIDLCFDPTADTLATSGRAVERQRVLAAAAPALRACAAAADVVVEVSVGVSIGEDGAVVDTQRDGELSGSEAARCAEDAVVGAAEFAPAEHPTDVWFHLRLDPDASDP